MLSRKVIQPFLYIFCAGIATIMDMALLYVFTDYLGVMYLVSATLSYSSGIFVNYALNRRITFRNKSRKRGKQFAMFTIISIIGLILTLLFMAIFVEFLGIWYMLAKLITIALVFIWSYNANSKLTFKIFR